MTALASFGANQALESMLTFATWQREFREADRRALKEALGTIRTAMVQPVGVTEHAKARDRRCVTGAEFDSAVTVAIAAAMVMWLSGALDELEVAR